MWTHGWTDAGSTTTSGELINTHITERCFLKLWYSEYPLSMYQSSVYPSRSDTQVWAINTQKKANLES